MYRKPFVSILSMVLVMSLGSSFADNTSSGRTPEPQKLINVNPDPDGQPWYAGGVPDKLTPEQLKKLESLPVLDFSKRNVELPYKADNSQNDFFRPVFNQQGGSCAQASGVGYQFTYEVNFKQNTSAKLIQNQFPSHYTWNYLNEGIGLGSVTLDGWDIIKATGCPTVATFGGMTGDDRTNTKYMNSYDKYVSGMNWRVDSVSRFKITTVEALNSLRQYLFDRGTGASVGGLVNFSTLVCDSTGKLVPIDTLADGTEEAGKLVVTKWGVTGGHAMTIVGYNDSVRFDYNGDGKYTNDIDINNDGVVDVRDWEIGAYIVANTWSEKWANDGFIYMMYKVGASPISEGGLTASNNTTCITAKTDYQTKLNYKVTIKHNIRSKIRLVVGIANDTAAQEPEYTFDYPIFAYQGGDHPLEGKLMSDEIEIALDVNPLLQYLSSRQAKFFFMVKSLGGSGKVTSFSLVEYRNPNKVIEVKCPQENVEIRNGTTVLSLNYAPQVSDMVIETQTIPNATVNESYTFALKASGGTEPYVWTVKQNQYTQNDITDSFPEISSTVLKPNDIDDGIAEQKIDFEFPFYGEKYSTVYVSTDGSILFTPDFKYIRSRNAIPRNKTITPFGADLTFETDGDDMYYEGNQECAAFRWKTTRFWGKDEKVNVDIAVKLYPSGKIQFFYNKELTNGISGLAHGFSAGNNDDYYILNIENTSQIPDNYALEFVPAQLPPGIEVKEDGTICGTPTVDNETWEIIIICTDANKNVKVKTYEFSTAKTPIVANGTMPSFKGFSYCKNRSHVQFTFATLKPGIVKLEVFDMSGKRIATVANEFKKAGLHSFTWDMQSKVSAKVSSGLYLCKLSTGKQFDVKRMILVK